MPGTLEDTIGSDEEAAPVDTGHRNYDESMEDTPESAHFLASTKHVPGCKRRSQSRLGCSRVPFIEPIGSSREHFYEAKLVLGLPWYCPEVPQVVKREGGQDDTEWTFVFDPPVNEIGGQFIEPEVLKLGEQRQVSFEMICHRLEAKFCDAELGIVCRCCTEEMLESPCRSCRYAAGFHICRNEHNDCGHHLWKKGTLHAGILDVQRVLFNLHRKLVPIDALKEKAKAYVESGLINEELAERVVRVIESERGDATYINDVQPGDQPDAAVASSTLTTRLSFEQLKELLDKRVEMMKQGGTNDGVTDQYRVYSHIIDRLQGDQPLRLMVQASAGTGKSFLLTTIFLWCIVNKKNTRAAAPTGRV